MVEEVFLGPILEGDVDLGGTARVGPLLEALEVSIQGSLNVLQHLSLHQPAAAPGDNDEIAALRRQQEQQLEAKRDAFDVILRANPGFAWKRSKQRFLGSGRGGGGGSLPPGIRRPSAGGGGAGNV